MSYHVRASTGDLLTRLMGDIQMLRELLVATLLTMVSEVTVLLGFLVALILIDRRCRWAKARARTARTTPWPTCAASTLWA